MCKFLHIRPLDVAQAMADRPAARPANKGGITIAYEVTDGVLRYAGAVCSERDNFCRKTGRTLAGGRLKSDRFSQTVLMQDGDTEIKNPEEYLRSLYTV